MLFFTQHPVRSLGQMACDSYDGTAVPFIWIEPVIEKADMLLAVGLYAHGAVGRFDKGPLEIVVDVVCIAPDDSCMRPPMCVQRTHPGLGPRALS